MQPVGEPQVRHSKDFVPLTLRVSAAWSWRVLVTLAAIGVVLWVVKPVRELIVALAVALLLRVLLGPFVTFLRRRAHLNKSLAAALGLIVGIVAVGSLLWLAIDQLIRSIPTFMTNVTDGIDRLAEWLNSLDIVSNDGQLDGFFGQFQNDLVGLLKTHSATVATEALGIATSAVGLVASALIMLFTLFFMLRDGRGMWVWFIRMFPEPARKPLNEATLRGWVTLGNYVRTQVLVAGIDAMGIGLGALILGLPLAIPITVLVFFGSFIPIVGAFVSGAVAVFIALVNDSITTAVIMLIIVVAVQQIEGHVLQPWLMSSAVSIHPVAVVLAVAAGSIIAGIPGAIFAVPLVSFVNVVTLYWHGHDTMPQLADDPNRPGGPPELLTQEIAASYIRERQPKRVATELDEPPATE